MNSVKNRNHAVMSFFNRSTITATAELLVLRSLKFWTDWWHLLQMYRVWHFGVLNIYRECHYDTKYTTDTDFGTGRPIS